MRPEFETTPKLGFGCMRLPLTDPADQQSIDLEQFKQMVDAFIEVGGTYFDTAFVYHEGASEKALKEALVKRYPRDAYTVATKCLAWAAPSAEEAKSNLTTSLERMGLDYVDFYLLHNVGGERTAKFDEYGMWDFALDAKERGLIRNVGFSMHDGADALDALLTAHPQMDFVQLQVNYLDWDDPVV
ncbi:Fe-S oxidoreductase, partial [Veillonella dispar]|nr:Fe-S oxidoreductase [Veillonella dispar]